MKKIHEIIMKGDSKGFSDRKYWEYLLQEEVKEWILELKQTATQTCNDGCINNQNTVLFLEEVFELQNGG